MRVLALAIDCIVCLFPVWGVLHISGWVFAHCGGLGAFVMPLWFGLLVGWPFAYFGIPTGLWGRTVGRFACGLRVKFGESGRSRLSQALVREALKLLSIFSVFGIFFCVFQILYTGTVWYDAVCGTGVLFSPGVVGRKVQRNFRQYVTEKTVSKAGGDNDRGNIQA